MDKQLKHLLENGYTPYQVCDIAESIVKDKGFKKVPSDKLPELKKGGKYFLSDGGTFVAFTVNSPDGFNIAAAHTDSPALKIKGGATLGTSPKRLNCEVYGGAINYSYFDIPLKVAGRIYTESNGDIVAHNTVSSYTLTVPSLAIHQQRDVNGSFAPSVQTDLTPIIGDGDFLGSLCGGGNAFDFDLYACPALEPYESGVNGEYICSPRIDNLTSVFSCLQALLNTEPRGINIAVCFNSEETGSRTRTAAGAAFFPDLLKEIYSAAGGKNFMSALKNSFMLSVDNAHATHPSHPEKSDPVNRVELGKGIVIKKHTNYATDALGAAILKKICAAANVPVQEFYSNSDLACGGTIGLISASNTGIHACDIGIAQLAMHASSELCAANDIQYMQNALTAFYSSSIVFTDEGAKLFE